MPPVRWKSISPATSDWFMVAISPTSLAPLNTCLAVSVNLAISSAECVLKGSNPAMQQMQNTFQSSELENAVLLVVGAIVPEVPALILCRGAADLVGVDDERIWSEPLAHAQKLLAVVAHGPPVRRLESRQHFLEIGLHLCPVERLDQLLRVHDLARPRVVDVDEVPDVGFTGSEPVDHRGVVGEGFSLDGGAGRLAEGIENLGGIVAFPAQDIELLLARRLRGSRQARGNASHRRRPDRRLLHEVAARNPVAVGHCYSP